MDKYAGASFMWVEFIHVQICHFLNCFVLIQNKVEKLFINQHVCFSDVVEMLKLVDLLKKKKLLFC